MRTHRGAAGWRVDKLCSGPRASSFLRSPVRAFHSHFLNNHGNRRRRSCSSFRLRSCRRAGGKLHSRVALAQGVQALAHHKARVMLASRTCVGLLAAQSTALSVVARCYGFFVTRVVQIAGEKTITFSYFFSLGSKLSFHQPPSRAGPGISLPAPQAPQTPPNVTWAFRVDVSGFGTTPFSVVRAQSLETQRGPLCQGC